MKAIILSAGKGSRMYPLTRNTPKCLLELGNGITVLESQINALLKCPKIEQIIVVTGYLSEQVEAKMGYFDGLVNYKILYNPFYDIADNFISLWVACSEMNTNFITINGDNIFSSDLINNLIDKSDHEITMVIDKKDMYDEDDMKVILKNNHVKSVSKKIGFKETNGESVGIIKYQNAGVARIKKTVLEMARRKESLSQFYLSALQEIMDKGFPVNYHECKKDEWAEIDFHPDLELIQKNITHYIKDSLDKILKD